MGVMRAGPCRAMELLWLAVVLLVAQPSQGFFLPSRARSFRAPVLVSAAEAGAPPAPVKKYESFDQMLQESDAPVLVDFYAKWCGPCQLMVPVLEEVAQAQAVRAGRW